MTVGRKRIRALLGATAVYFGAGVALAAGAAPAAALAQQARTFDIPAQPLPEALQAFGRQSGLRIAVDDGQVAGLRSVAVRGAMTPQAALRRMTSGLGVEHQFLADGAVVVRRPARSTPVATRRRVAYVPGEAGGDASNGSPAALEEVVVTARRMEERIIDVPVSVSAFSAQQLNDLKIEGGSELLRGVPNVSFSKDNFTGYNFAIRGVGTKAMSVTADPAVAISFNNTALLRNRLFEQEYFDVQRVEVLRGPQGTLYGRNATAGVVNMLPNAPKLGEFTAEAQGEVGNYDSRRARGFVNLPLGETLALRFAGALTQRDGFDFNTTTDQNVNGRDLWSTRVGALWKPNARFSANLLWEHFNEDDDRSRTGKQLCTRGAPPKDILWTDPSGASRTSPVFTRWTMDSLTPGCQNKSLYTDAAYGTPNGRGMPLVTGLITILPFTTRGGPDNDTYLFRMGIDPFGSASGRQSTDLREIATFYDPKFKAENDVVQLNLEFDLTPRLTLHSQTLYMEDSYYGSQDFFRYDPAPGLIANREGRALKADWNAWLGAPINGNGTFVDPQLGTLDRLAAVDISQSKSSQYSQEFRLQSSFDGRFNFNLGANYLKFKTQEDYYIFSNAFTMIAVQQNLSANYNPDCTPKTATAKPNACVYIDPNPIDKIDGQGHNYYRSLDLARTESWAVFGEGYFKLSDKLRMTAGLRYTEDTKSTIPVPTQLLAADSFWGGGTVGKGYPRGPEQTQNWSAVTGRLAVDYKPDLSFTDDSLVYASYSRGYKAGGGNPPGPDWNEANSNYPKLPRTFDPEYVDAFELGTKNALQGGRLMLNASAFYYDYKDYQVSQFIDRSMHTETFDAKTWGLELEAAWTPVRNFRLDATLGWLQTRIASGETSVDVMDRLQGRTDYTVMRPWPTSPMTCIVPNEILGRYIQNLDVKQAASSSTGQIFIKMLCPGPTVFQNGFLPGSAWSNAYRDQWGPLVYNPLTYIDPVTGVHATNQGRGFSADLGGNSLPNAPELTFNLGAQYRINLPGSWDMTLRGDYYRQSDSFARVYNSEYDRLKSWQNVNLSATVVNREHDLALQVYVKNVLNDTPITDAYTGPDELGNFTNVFTLDPRIIGVSLRKGF
ncbi:TonB-dependent receptor [Caulobacter radicis]|uniref:TonB-dependent receptor domain-containing protein n=1 Tax=Caulobacter radicis TaxID=2172650 RepID=UPI000D569FAB|nr:TonB-dependent receptor [Caulobacter radicis]PVM84132.1 TonB-dependent receptor [Caulobacter radicis]